MKEHFVLWFSDLGHPEDRHGAYGWFEDHWERRPESQGLESAVGKRGTDVEGIEAVGQEEDQDEKSHLHGQD